LSLVCVVFVGFYSGGRAAHVGTIECVLTSAQLAQESVVFRAQMWASSGHVWTRAI
jgi:hypothetical protein